MNLLSQLRGINPILGSWHRREWLFYFAVIPTTLIIIFLLPISIKQYLILDLQNPTLLSIFVNHYTHTDLAHLTNNLIGYLLTVFILFNIETNRSRFHRVTAFFLIAVPFICSLTMIRLFPIPYGMLGFSAVTSAFTGYIVYSANAYLRSRYSYIQLGFITIPLLANFTLLCINNNFGTPITLISSFLLIVFLIIERKNIIRLIKELDHEIKIIPKKNAGLEFTYKLCTLTLTIILVFSLPNLIPTNIEQGKMIVNTIIHYIAWIIGVFLPIGLDILKLSRKTSRS